VIAAVSARSVAPLVVTAGGGAGADRRLAGSLGGGRHGGDEGSRAAPPGV
jgi:hypothetical protein